MRLIILALICLSLLACSEPVDYTFGFSAEESNRFLLVTAKYDDYMNVPAGVIGCCLASGGASASMFPEKYPKKGYFVWYDKLTESYYRAYLTYPDNIKTIADELGDLVYWKDGSTSHKSVYLITSITSNNEAITWLSNTMRNSKALTKRELVELDRAKGESFVPEFIKERRRKRLWMLKRLLR